MKKIIAISFITALVIAACTKVPDLPYYANGTTVVLTPSTQTVTPSLADTAKEIINFSWTSPKYATDSNTYKYVLEIDTAGRNFTKVAMRIVTGKLGTALTGRQINTILLNYGYALGTPVKLDVRVKSSYGNNNEQYTSNTVAVTVTPFNDPAKLITSNSSVTGTLANAALLSNTFSWSQPFAGYTDSITYTLQYDSATKNFANVKEFPVGRNKLSQGLTQGEMNETALSVGVPGSNLGKVEYRIKAVTAGGATSYSNTVSVTIQSYLSIVRFYMPGGYQGATGNGANWDPPTAPEFVRDLRAAAFNQLYYMYIWLPAGAEFKITPARTWDVAYGGSGGNLSTSGPNISVATAGYYRISIDRVNLKYDIREGRMGFVGGATGAGWNPPNVFPNYAMGLASTNLFVGVTTFTVDGWKLIDHNDWNSGDINVTNARSYGATGASGSTLIVNGANMPDITTAGRYRIIWDGRNRDNVKYEMSPAAEMRVVGDGMQGVPAWTPGASPQMTYSGNGVWTITLTLVAGKDIKFLAGNDWGAFDYEDNSGGSTATGVARKIKWEGGDNFKTPTTTGSYTITLNENMQTVTIN